MSRTIGQLKEEAKILGVFLPENCSVEVAKEQLAEMHWAVNNPFKPMPRQFKCMLARDASKLSKAEFSEMYDNSNWVAELKLNGCRGIMVLENGEQPRIHSRRRSDEHHRFEEKIENVPQFRNFPWVFDGLTVLDGELVHEAHSIVTTEGTKTENQLQTAVAILNSEAYKGKEMQVKYGNLKYWIFDILFHNGADLRDLPFWKRRKALEEFFASQNCPDLELCPQWEKPADGFYNLYKKLVESGFEGIMLKEKKGTYVSTGRPKTMWKMKRAVTYDAFITGFVPAAKGKGFENYIGAFELSAFIDGVQKVIGSVSSIDLETRKKATIYKNGLPTLNPEFLGRCMEIKGQEVTKNGRLFHCQMVDWRPDKSPEDCKILGSLFYAKSKAEEFFDRSEI